MKEVGTHTELLKVGGVYSALVSRQMDKANVPAQAACQTMVSGWMPSHRGKCVWRLFSGVTLE